MGSKLALCHASTDCPRSLSRGGLGVSETGSEIPPHRAFVPCGPFMALAWHSWHWRPASANWCSSLLLGSSSSSGRNSQLGGMRYRSVQ